MASSLKTARTLNKKKENELCSSIDRIIWTVCVHKRTLAANEKFGFQPMLKRVEHCC